jgi:hypothetical protein
MHVASLAVDRHRTSEKLVCSLRFTSKHLQPALPPVDTLLRTSYACVHRSGANCFMLTQTSAAVNKFAWQSSHHDLHRLQLDPLLLPLLLLRP